MSPKRIFLLAGTLLLLVLGAGLKVAPAQWTQCGEPSTRMAAFLPMIEISATHVSANDSAKYATVYDCAEWNDVP